MSLFDKLKNATQNFQNSMNNLGMPTTAQTPQVQQSAPTLSPQVSQPAPTPQPKAPRWDYFDPQLEKLIEMALADGQLDENEKKILFRKAESMGVDLDELEMVLNARLHEINNQAPSGASASKSSKFGDIKKCPACGATVQAFSAVCPECGHEFRDIEANSNIQGLFDLLNDVDRQSNKKSSAGGFFGMMNSALEDEKINNQKEQIIQNYPIPNTKEDLLEFLALSIPQTRSSDLSRAWKAKAEQVVIKARFALKNDPAALEEIMQYAKQMKLKV